MEKTINFIHEGLKKCRWGEWPVKVQGISVSVPKFLCLTHKLLMKSYIVAPLLNVTAAG